MPNSTRHAHNVRRQRRVADPRYCQECARKGQVTRLNSLNKGPDCLPCRRAAADRLVGYP
jgi:hypothetical protein